ncbi:MAG: hypothetical protein AAGE52_05475 [Myxococcota bacterium]
MRTFLFLFLLGCTVSPQPTPPNLDPQGISVPPNGPEVDSALIFQGGRGAVDPPEGAIVIVNLDLPDPPAAEPVRPDGSFDVPVTGFGNEEFRLQVRSGATRSEPIDVVTADVDLIPAPRPFADCFVARTGEESDREIDFGAIRRPTTHEVEIENLCDETLELDVRLRVDNGTFRIVEAPSSIGTGETERVLVEAVTPIERLEEDTLLIEVSAPMPDRRPITLFVQRR